MLLCVEHYVSLTPLCVHEEITIEYISLKLKLRCRESKQSDVCDIIRSYQEGIPVPCPLLTTLLVIPVSVERPSSAIRQ